MAESVENLGFWQRDVRFMNAGSEITRHWPSEEQYRLTSQIRRAAVSVPTNVAEGVGRGSRREILRFARVSFGSLYELSTLLTIAEELGYIGGDAAGELKTSVSGLTRQISSFIRYQESRLPISCPHPRSIPPQPSNHRPHATCHSHHRRRSCPSPSLT